MDEQEQDLGIMRALGAKPRRVAGIVFVQTLLIAVVGGGVGISLGFFVTFAFFVPEPVISQGNLVLIAAWLLLALCLLCISGLYSAFRVLRKSLANVMSNS